MICFLCRGVYVAFQICCICCFLCHGIICVCWSTDCTHCIPITWKYFMELKAKLFKISIKCKNVMTTFLATVLLGWLSWPSLTAFIPSLFGMFVYSDLKSRVTSKQWFGIFFTLSKFWRKSVVSLAYEEIFLTIGWRWKSRYFQKV